MAISDKQRETVLRCLEQGLSLRKACTKAEVATPTAIHRLCDADTAFSDQYARARQEGYAVLAEQLIESLDDNDTDPARLPIQVDTRKWMLSKMLPKIYGDKLELSGDKENPLQTVTRIEIVPMRKDGE